MIDHCYVAPQTQQTASDQSSPNACIYPNCNKPKYVESDGTTHPYCGKTHAELAKQQGIFRESEVYYIVSYIVM